MFEKLLVPISANWEAMTPVTNYFIMLGRSIRLLRHLKHQNLSNGDDFIYSSEIICLVPVLATREAVALLANDPILFGTLIQLFRQLEHQNPS